MNLTVSALRFVAVGALLSSAMVFAADRGSRSDAEARYQRDRAACINGETHQDRATCLREAGAALQEARRGGLTADASQYERNRLARCDLQPADDREDCIRRMNGEGTVSGSVEGGGIYRELRTIVPAK